jgi:hypothetical protein
MEKYACSFVSNTEAAKTLPRVISFDVGPRTLAICTLVEHLSETHQKDFPWGDLEIVSWEQTDILRDHLVGQKLPEVIDITSSDEDEEIKEPPRKKSKKEEKEEAKKKRAEEREEKKAAKEQEKLEKGKAAGEVKSVDLGAKMVEALLRRMDKIFPEGIPVRAVVVEQQPPFAHTKKWEILSHYIVAFFQSWFRIKNLNVPVYIDLFSAKHKNKILRMGTGPVKEVTPQGLLYLQKETQRQLEEEAKKKEPKRKPALKNGEDEKYEERKIEVRDELPFLLSESPRNAHLLEFFFERVPKDNDMRDICDATLQAFAFCFLAKQEREKQMKKRQRLDLAASKKLSKLKKK